MQDPALSFLGTLATVWASYGVYLQLLLALLFALLVLNWLSAIAVRVDGLSLVVGDLKKDIEKVKDALSDHGQSPKN